MYKMTDAKWSTNLNSDSVNNLCIRETRYRFQFGKNWRHFLTLLNENRIDKAIESLKDLTDDDELAGRRFLDVGSGSGLFSLAAYRKGAQVTSFDYDEESVCCTVTVRDKYWQGDNRWRCMRGSVLDGDFLRSLGLFDIVYAWGVLHHTGNMWQALDNVSKTVSSKGTLVVSIYNDQGLLSRYWRKIKITYNKAWYLRPLLIIVHAPYLIVLRFLVRVATERVRLERGMSYWHDMLDWLGGYPFEVAKPAEIIDFLTKRGFVLRRLKTCGKRSGCNEFVFERHR